MELSKLQTIDYVIKRFLKDDDGNPRYRLLINLAGSWYTCDAVRLIRGEYIAYPKVDAWDGIEDARIHPDQQFNSSKYSAEQIYSTLGLIWAPTNSTKLQILNTTPNATALFHFLTELIEPLTNTNDLPEILLNVQSYPGKEIKIPFIKVTDPISAASIIEVS